MRQASFLRSLMVGVLLALTMAPGLAQGPYRYLVQVAELNSPFQEKLITDLLRNGYPMIAFRVDADGGSVEIGSSQVIERAGLTADLAAYGLTLTAMYRQDRSNGFHRWLAVGTGTGMPTYQDTGDPIADQAAYEAAKEAWLQERALPKNDLTQAGH